MKRILIFSVLLALCLPAAARAQTIDDGIMLTKRSMQAGVVYTHDAWKEYWEGTLKRSNGNIGTLTTEMTNLTGAYGLSDRITLFASVPYARTTPSQGVLQGQQGLQDAMFGAKASLMERALFGGQLRIIGAASGTVPVTDYNPDFAPLSIGNQSRTLAGRATVNYQTESGLYVNATSSYAHRSDVTLDRPYYYTDGQLFFTDVVEMPDIADFSTAIGYLKHDLNTNVSYSLQRTRGGGDIRRQDMPFLSNRVNVSRVGAMAMYPVPKFRAVAAYASFAHVVDGRNVGQSNTVAVGLLYSYAGHGRLIR